MSVSAAAEIAKAEPSIQAAVVAMPDAERRDAVRKLKEDAERARQVAEEQEEVTGPTAFTKFLKKNGRYPNAEEAEVLAKLDYRKTPDDTHKLHSPYPKPTKEQRQAERESKPFRQEAWRVGQAVVILGRNEADPALVLKHVKFPESDFLEENLERAVDWLNRFAKQWRKR